MLLSHQHKAISSEVTCRSETGIMVSGHLLSPENTQRRPTVPGHRWPSTSAVVAKPVYVVMGGAWSQGREGGFKKP